MCVFAIAHAKLRFDGDYSFFASYLAPFSFDSETQDHYGWVLDDKSISSVSSNLTLSLDLGVPWLTSYTVKTYSVNGLIPMFKDDTDKIVTHDYVQLFIGDGFRWWIPTFMVQKERATARGIVKNTGRTWDNKVYDGTRLMQEGEKIPLKTDLLYKAFLWE